MSRALAIDVRRTDDESFSVQLGNFGSGRKPRIERLDRALLFEHRDHDVLFWGIGEVTDVRAEPDKTLQSFSAEVAVGERFDSDRSLDDYRFSLARVRRLSKPQRHFTRRYVVLDSSDAKTLISGTIFWQRTVVGLLAECLPARIRAQLFGAWIDRRERTYEELAGSVLRFVQQRYGATAELLRHVSDQAETIVLDEDRQVERVVLAENPEDHGIELLHLATLGDPLVDSESPAMWAAFEELLSHDIEPEAGIRLKRTFSLDAADLSHILMVAA